MNGLYILRDIDNRDENGAPWETAGTLQALAKYVGGALLKDITDNEAAEDIRAVAAEMERGVLSDESQARLKEVGVYVRLAGVQMRGGR